MTTFTLRVALLASTAAAFVPRPRSPRVRGSVFAESLRRPATGHCWPLPRPRKNEYLASPRSAVPRATRWRRALRVLAANALLAITLLFAPPAHAKGGGGGGGGGRGGSSSRMLNLSQLGWRCHMDESGFPCWHNTITNQRTWKRPSRQKKAPPVFYAPSFGHLEGRSAFGTRPARNYVVGGDTVAAEPSNVGSMMAFLGVYYGILEWTQRRRKNVYRERLDAWKNLTRTLEHDFDGTQRPGSGQYCGDSIESDKGDQDVVTSLRFLSDGSVRGDGVDCKDGKYTLAGRWSGGRCLGSNVIQISRSPSTAGSRKV